MKRTRFLISTLALAAALMVACEKPNSSPVTPPEEPETPEEPSTPEEPETPDEPEGPTYYNLSAAGNANCYVIDHVGPFRFDANVAGNGVDAPSIEPKGVKLLWQTTPGLITDLKLEDNAISFGVSDDFGNALIAATDEEGNVIWSWHIWHPKEMIEEIETKTGYMIANLNIGALVSTPGSLDSYGMYYQWGRKDPFPSGPTLTGDTKTMPVDLYDIDGEVVAVGYSSWYSDASNNLDYSIANPTVVIAGMPLADNPKNYKDWLKEANYGLWGNPEGNVMDEDLGYPNKGRKSCYDPCPVGWRVPPKDVLSTATETGTFSFDESEFDIDGDFNYGYHINMAEGSSYFPASCRYYGEYGMLYGTYCGLWGNYWSNAPCIDNNQASSILAFQNTNGSAFMSTIANGARSDAYPVRCIRDIE